MNRRTHTQKARIRKLRNSGFPATTISRLTHCPLHDVRELLYGSVTKERRNRQNRKARKAV
jgi:hypothetical protein